MECTFLMLFWSSIVLCTSISDGNKKKTKNKCDSVYTLQSALNITNVKFGKKKRKLNWSEVEYITLCKILITAEHSDSLNRSSIKILMLFPLVFMLLEQFPIKLSANILIENKISDEFYNIISKWNSLNALAKSIINSI